MPLCVERPVLAKETPQPTTSRAQPGPRPVRFVIAITNRREEDSFILGIWVALENGQLRPAFLSEKRDPPRQTAPNDVLYVGEGRSPRPAPSIPHSS